MSLMAHFPFINSSNKDISLKYSIQSGTSTYDTSIKKMGSSSLNSNTRLTTNIPWTLWDPYYTSSSFGGWFYFDETEVTNCINNAGWTTSATNMCGNLLGYNSYSGLSLTVSNTSKTASGTTLFAYLRNDNSNNWCSAGAGYIEFGKWKHYFLTYDKENNKLSIYVNGILTSSTTTNPNTTAPSRYSNFSINDGQTYGGNGPSVYFPCRMNDVILYNHCLSAKEVKEISKGLVLHYKLDNNGFGNENLVAGSLKNVTSSNYGFATISGISLENDTTYTFTANGRTNSSSDNRYLVAYIYDSGWSLLSKTVTIKENTDTTRSVTFTTPSNASDYNFKISTYYYPSSSTTATSNCTLNWYKLEKGSVATPWCPNSTDTLYTTLGLNNTTIEKDCSGYNNDGTINGTITSLGDTPRYSSSNSFNGTDSSIKLPIVPPETFTFSIWFNRNNGYSSKSWETILGGPSGFELESKSSSSSTPVIYAYSWGKGSFSYDINKWNHLVMVRTTTDTKFYLNGELKLTGSTGSIPSGNYYLGSWSTATSQSYKGSLSDARIYATALSESDIKELYNTSMSIDKNGNLYAYELVEE